MKRASGEGKLPSERKTLIQALQECVDDDRLFAERMDQYHLELLLDCARFAATMAPDDDAVLALMEEWEE